MAVTTPPTLTVAPLSPDRSDRTTFSARAIALDEWTKNSQVPQMSALGANVYANAVDAAASATTATNKAVLTAADRVQTGLDRVQTGLDAIAAAGLDKRYLGAKSTAPTLDNQGAALQAGAVYYDTVLSKVRTWTGSAWVEGISAVAGVASVNGLTGAVALALLLNKSYALRSDLRSMTPAPGDAAIVDGLGLFVWASGSTEPDDDESCFVTISGAWLLEAPHWDVIDSYIEPEINASNSRILTGSAVCAITSVATVSSAAFSGTVTGAAIGDRVVATPPGQLGSSSAATGCLSYHAWVSAANTVTVMLTNASAGTATTNSVIQTDWPITVIKA